MRYLEFRDAIECEIRRNLNSLRRLQMRERLDLACERPNLDVANTSR